MSFGWSASAAQAAPSSGPAASRAARGRAMSGLAGAARSGTGAASTGALGARLAATPARCRRDRRRSARGRLARAALRPGAPRGGRRGREVIAPRDRQPVARRRADVSLRARTRVTGETFAGDPAALLADVRAGQFRRLRSRELNEALQYLGRGANWRLVYDVFDQLVEPDPDPDAPAASSPQRPRRHHRPLRSRTQRRPRARPFHLRMDARAGTRSIRAHRVHVHRVHPSRGRRRRRWRDAFAVYRDMRAAGVSPTTHTYSALIRGAAKGGKGWARTPPPRWWRTCDSTASRPTFPSRRRSSARTASRDNSQTPNGCAEPSLTAKAEAGGGRASGGGSAGGGAPGAPGRVSGTSRRSGRPDAKLYTEFLIAACRCAGRTRAAAVFESRGFPADDVHVHGGNQSVRRVRRVG